MNRVGVVFLSMIWAVTFSFGQASAPPAAAIGHGAFPVKVNKTLDSSKLKEGDTVELETTGAFKLPEGTLVPKGSKVIGHVTTAKSRSKGDAESQLSIAFDKLNITNGKGFSLKGTIQAVFPPPDEVDPGVPSAPSMHSGGGAPPPMPDYKPTTDMKVGTNESSSGSQGAMNPKSVGVHGIDNLQLENGVLHSKGKQVKLGGGVQMIVQAEIM